MMFVETHQAERTVYPRNSTSRGAGPRATPDRPLLQIENLRKSFTLHNLGGKAVQGFAPVSFTLPQGKALAMCGPSGAGKSSILKCIYRTYLPSAGRIWYQTSGGERLDLAGLPEHDITHLRHREMGYVSQFLKVLPRVKAVDVVAEPLLQGGHDGTAARKQAAGLLSRLNIPRHLHDAYPVTFSGGEQQRVNIARAVIRRPRLLLLDEPTASLDAHSVQVVLELLNDIRRQGSTLVMICHDATIARRMADTVLTIHHKEPQVKICPVEGDHPRALGQKDVLITHADLVLPDRIARNSTLRIAEGRIAAIGPPAEAHSHDLTTIDAEQQLVMPGFIDLHSDAIEKAIEPRPRAALPLEVALTELDKNLAACGITTMYHCLSFTGRENHKLRHYKQAGEMVRRIKALSPDLLVDTRIHARFEMLDTECLPLLHELMEADLVDLLSFMDHTPGQGQFTNIDYLYEYYTQADHLSREEVDRMIECRLARSREFDDGHLRELARHCRDKGIPLASHDDDTAEKVAWVYDLGVRICEFPVTLKAAQAAKAAGMDVLMGAPNILFGRSLTDNLSGRTAIENGVCNLMGSDYSPHTLLHAIFALERSNFGRLPELVPLVSSHPAKATNRASESGALAVGLAADLTFISLQGNLPRITRTLRNGRQIYAAQ